MTSQPQPTRRGRRGAPHTAPTRSTRRRRRLWIEALEERALLASDLGLLAFPEGEGETPLMAVRLTAVDPLTFLPVEAVHQGEEFFLLASVEDLRPNASGVFGAYFDLVYPASSLALMTEPGEASLFYGSGFGNGKTGDVLPGLIDEFGTFAADSNPPGPGEQLLAGVRMVATQVGTVQISSDAAEEAPAHEMLLFDRDAPVATEFVTYGDLALEILPPLPDKAVDAIADIQVVRVNSTENLLAVMENDKNTTDGPLVITSVDANNSHGKVTIGNNGALLVYTPDRGFVGTDQFAYTITADGQEDTALVTVQVEPANSREVSVAYDLQITDRAGNPVSAVNVGDDFVLHVTAEDLRAVPSGVFAAYLDVRYTSASAELAGPITYGVAYTNGQNGNTSVRGEIDEVGAFSGADPLGGGAFEVFQIPFHATSPGRIVFAADPAENLPSSQTLLFDDDAVVAKDDIRFGSVALTVVPTIVAIDDTYEVQVGSSSHTFDVLKNDVSRGGGILSVVAVDTAGVFGTVEVAPNGRGVIYSPAPGFGGSEQFRYTVSGPAGSSTAEVTVHVQPAAAQDDRVEIRLATTDLAGHSISSIQAGQDFLVQAFVQDLRGPGTDRGVYATYLDLLYPRAAVHPIPTQVGPFGPAIEFGADYRNGLQTDAAVPGVFNEIGAFQTGTTPLGTAESLLFAARFQAASARGEADSFQMLEDEQATLSVLENDLPNLGEATFQADPADDFPWSDTLLYEPVEPVPFGRIRYGAATIEITAGSTSSIVAVSSGNAGGSISIGNQGTSLLYTPATNFSGVETFTYSLDGQSHIEVSVNVLPVNDAPLARSDLYRVRENQTLTVAAKGGVLANDSDLDGDALEALLGEHPSHGTLQLAVDGSLIYVPDDNYVGRDSFSYRANDGQAASSLATVGIDVVARPVSIRLEAIDSSSNSITEVTADQPIVVRAAVQDLRSVSEAELGIGAAYLDIAYDVNAINPVLASDGPLGLAVQFGPAYPNGMGGELLLEGRLNDLGAFQAGFEPLGGDEIELFRIAFDVNGPRAADDSYHIAAGAAVNQLNVLTNESELQWDVTLDAQYAANSPNADVAYLDPAETVPESDISFGDITLAARNGELTIQSISDTASGATVSFDSSGVVTYEPAEEFTGLDAFTYVVVDVLGRTAMATVTLEVVESWQNSARPTDVNGDGTDSPLDALVIVNELNEVGPHKLEGGVITAFLDVNGDGSVSPVDALQIINRLIEKSLLGEGETVTFEPNPHQVDTKYAPVTPLAASDGIAEGSSPGPPATSPSVVSQPLAAISPSLTSILPRIDANTAGISSDLEPDPLSDLLDTLAKDVAALRADFP